MRFPHSLSPALRNRKPEVDPQLLATLLELEREINALKSVFNPGSGS